VKQSEKNKKSKTSISKKKGLAAEPLFPDMNNLFQALTTQSTDIILLINRESKIAYANTEAEMVLGVKKDDIVGSEICRYFHPDDAGLAVKLFDKFFSDVTPRILREELRIFHRDGTWHPAELTGTNLSRGHAVEAVIVSLRDVTQQKKTEEALRQSEARYRFVAENITECVWVMDLKLNLIYISPSVEKVYGYSLDEVKNMSLKYLLTPESYKKMLEAFSTQLPAATNSPPPPPGTRYVLELEAFHKDGHRIWVENRLGLIRDEHGKPVFLMGETIDVTDRKIAEEKLLAEERRFRALAEQSSDIIVIVNSKGVITYENPAVGILGYSPEERIGANAFELIHPDDQQFIAQMYEKIFQDPELPVQKGEVRLRHKNGSWRIFEAIGSNLVKNNTVEAAVVNLRDITERKKNEEMMLLIKTAVEGSTDAIGISDAQGNHFYQNRAFNQLFGYTLKELQTLGVLRTLYANRDVSRDVFKTIIQGGAWGGEIECVTKNGRKLNILLRANAIQDEAGKIVGLLGIHTDITERKKAEMLIQKSEERYRLLADHMKDQVWLMDMNMNITYISPSVEKALGYTLEEIRKLPIDKLLTPESFQKATDFITNRMPKAFKLASRDFQYKTLELAFVTKAGEILWGECSFNFIRDENDKPVSILGEARNVTERKIAEEKLRESEEKYRTILEEIQEGYFETDLAGNFTFFNDTVCRSMGYTREELVGMNNRQYTDEEELKKVYEAFNKVYTTGQPCKNLEWKVNKKDGSKLYVEGFISLLKDASGNPIGFRGVTRDITERKLAEEKLQETLESLKKAVETTIQVLVSALEARDPYTAGHQSRTANLACAIAAEMGLSKEQIEGIKMAGIIHDIGKLSIPAEILSKPSKLTKLEYSLIKIHPQSGHEMLKNVASPWPLAKIVQQHHERMDGSGYPHNLKEDEILIEARILAVADVVEAMASHRPYRASLGIEAAISELQKNRGILYDEAVVDACLKLLLEKGYELS
jgi:PAS domain S-box-containing protein